MLTAIDNSQKADDWATDQRVSVGQSWADVQNSIPAPAAPPDAGAVPSSAPAVPPMAAPEQVPPPTAPASGWPAPNAPLPTDFNAGTPAPNAPVTAPLVSPAPQSRPQTTVEISGGSAFQGFDTNANALVSWAGDQVRGQYGDEAARAVQSVLATEGGLSGGRGDHGNSFGPLQFFRGGELANYASYLGTSQDQAGQYAEQHPQEAIQWALNTYLGNALQQGLKQGLTGSDLATFLQRTGQRSESPQRAGQWYNTLFAGGQDPFSQPITAGAAGASGITGPAQRTSQFALGLSTSDAMSFCGPAAAIAFAQTYGRNPTVDEAKQLATEVGWNPNQGMAGVGSEQALLTKMGVQTKLEQNIDWNHVASDANNGNPVIIDTPGHYFYVTGARQGPNGQEFNVGTSGTDLRQGSQWMTPADMARTMGNPRAALYADHPLAAGPSVAESGKSPMDQIGQGIGSFAQGVGQKANDVVQAVQSVGQTNTPGPPIQGPYTSLLPGGTQNPVEAEQQTAQGMLQGVGFGHGALDAIKTVQDLNEKYANAPSAVNVGGVTLTVDPKDMTPEDQQAYQGAILAVGGAIGEPGAGGRPLFGRGGVPGADVGRNPIPAPTQPGDVQEALAQSQLQVLIKQARAQGMSDDQIGQVFKGIGASDEQITNALHPPEPEMVPPSGPPPQQPIPEQAAPPVGAGPGEPPAPPPAAPPTPPSGPEGPQMPPLNMLTQAQDLPKPSGVRGTLSSAFQPTSNLPPEAQQALKEYAAAVGPDSNAARVEAQQVARAAGSIGAEVDQRVVQANAAIDARETLNQKLSALGLQNDPQVQTVIHNIEDSGKIASNPLGKALLQAQSEIKGVIFPLSTFHAYTEGLYSTFSSPSGGADFAKAFFSNSSTQAAQDSPIWLRAAKAGVTGLFDRNAPDAPSTLGGLPGAAIRSGIGAVGGAGAGYVETKTSGGTDEQARQNAMIGALAGGIGAPLAKPLISDNLWRAVQYSKVKTFESLVGGGLDDQAAADAVNRTFGGLNYAQMGRNRDLQNVLRLTVQAPDWNEATLRQLGSAFFGNAGGAGFSRGVVARTVAGTALATEILNYAFTGHSTFENDPGHQGQVELPAGTADKPVYIGIGPGNLQAYTDLAAKIASNPQNALQREYYSRGQLERDSGDIPQFILNRTATIPSDALAAATGGQTTFAGSRAPLAAELAAPLSPISISNFVQAQQHQMSPATTAFLTAIGANPRYASGSASTGVRRPVSTPQTTGKRPTRPTRP